MPQTFVLPLHQSQHMARRAGFEPTSYGLEDRHVLRYTIDAYRARAEGFEPSPGF